MHFRLLTSNSVFVASILDITQRKQRNNRFWQIIRFVKNKLELSVCLS